jgi:hypothetical protein
MRKVFALLTKNPTLLLLVMKENGQLKNATGAVCKNWILN